jgi:hypothetical protein
MMSQASAWLLKRAQCTVRVTNAFTGALIYKVS